MKLWALVCRHGDVYKYGVGLEVKKKHNKINENKNDLSKYQYKQNIFTRLEVF